MCCACELVFLILVGLQSICALVMIHIQKLFVHPLGGREKKSVPNEQEQTCWVS